MNLKKERCARRKFRVRAKLRSVVVDNLRMSIFKSNKHFYAQLIDDKAGVTLLSASSLKIDITNKKGTEIANLVGIEFGKKVAEAKIDRKVFLDRGPHLYHGKVAAFAQGVRDQGVEF